MDTPILFLFYNRPETTFKVFEKIKLYQPKELYLASDGPRKDRDNEKSIVLDLREQILDKIDWDCNVKILFRNNNLGCKLAVSNAIDWFFSFVEKGIILEDDCVPSLSFFSFMETALDYYKNQDEIFMISGFNKHPSVFSPNQFYSKIGSIWGWGTWRNRWAKYDVELKNWKTNYTEIELKRDVDSKIIFQKLVNDFNAIKNNKIDTWDIQVQFLLLKEKMYCIYPKKNLITNIGIIGHHSTGVTQSHNKKSYNNFKFLDGIILKGNWFFEFNYKLNIIKNNFKSRVFRAIKKL